MIVFCSGFNLLAHTQQRILISIQDMIVRVIVRRESEHTIRNLMSLHRFLHIVLNINQNDCNVPMYKINDNK